MNEREKGTCEESIDSKLEGLWDCMNKGWEIRSYDYPPERKYYFIAYNKKSGDEYEEMKFEIRYKELSDLIERLPESKKEYFHSGRMENLKRELQTLVKNQVLALADLLNVGKEEKKKTLYQDLLDRIEELKRAVDTLKDRLDISVTFKG